MRNNINVIAILSHDLSTEVSSLPGLPDEMNDNDNSSQWFAQVVNSLVTMLVMCKEVVCSMKVFRDTCSKET